MHDCLQHNVLHVQSNTRFWLNVHQSFLTYHLFQLRVIDVPRHITELFTSFCCTYPEVSYGPLKIIYALFM